MNFCCGNYSREETIQGWKLRHTKFFHEIFSAFFKGGKVCFLLMQTVTFFSIVWSQSKILPGRKANNWNFDFFFRGFVVTESEKTCDKLVHEMAVASWNLIRLERTLMWTHSWALSCCNDQPCQLEGCHHTWHVHQELFGWK